MRRTEFDFEIGPNSQQELQRARRGLGVITAQATILNWLQTAALREPAHLNSVHPAERNTALAISLPRRRLLGSGRVLSLKTPGCCLVRMHFCDVLFRREGGGYKRLRVKI
jgi:hypothetical protein